MSISVYDKTTGQLTPIAGVPAMKLAALTRNMAAEEKMNVASRSFSIGEYVIRSDDKLYKVIAPVQFNDFWEVGTNIEEACLGEEIKNNFDASLDCLTNSVETGNRATRNYNTNEYLYYVDIVGEPHYAKVTQPIVIGNPIINGDNVSNITVGLELGRLNEGIGASKRAPDFSITSTGQTGLSTYGDLLKEIIVFLKSYISTDYYWLPRKCYIIEVKGNDFITYQLNENTSNKINFSFVTAFTEGDTGGPFVTVRTISLGLTDGDLYRASNTTGSIKITNNNIGQGNRLEFYFY